MRKLTSLVLAAVLLLSCTVTAFAAESDPVEIGVYAKCEYNIQGEYTAPVEAGAASAAGVAVADAPENALILVVIPMEGEAFAWIGGCIEEEAVAAFSIHFLDAQGNRINADGAKVSITVSGQELTVSSVNKTGEATQLTSGVSSEKVSFTADSNPYFVIAREEQSITVPVRGEDNTVHADVTVTEEDTVKLHELDGEEIDHIVGDDVNTGVVEIDLTGLEGDITKIVLPVTTVEHIVEAAEEAGNDTEALQVDFSNGSVKLDDQTMRAVVDQAECNEVILVLETVGETRLNDTQDAALADMDVVAGYEAYMLCVAANKRISDFEGGVATLSVPFTVPAGNSESGYTVWHVADNGTMEKLNSWFADGKLYWNVGHFSDFIVTYEAAGVETEYDVTVKKTSGGTAEVDDDTPVAGQTVTVTAKPNSGKVVNKVTVTDADGNAVKVTDNGDGTYSFTQPDSDVTVKVTFKSQSSSDSPQTGDHSHILLWTGLLLLSLALLLLMKARIRKSLAE